MSFKSVSKFSASIFNSSCAYVDFLYTSSVSIHRYCSVETRGEEFRRENGIERTPRGRRRARGAISRARLWLTSCQPLFVDSALQEPYPASMSCAIKNASILQNMSLTGLKMIHDEDFENVPALHLSNRQILWIIQPACHQNLLQPNMGII
ncbi:uncharacterized protein LOC100679148 isoform X1 [Nasonia vitripennis]|uniref:Uncharacterized protein n=1 Tax=Nasonia vitripennis TaxID=7425 RepID=A0A7M7QE51_NASVI|nr:uncharacterized protein LOC100679148 isoform X1 [Nasonia vitripennis]